MEMDRSTPSSLGAIHIRGHGWKVTNTNISTTGTYAAGIYLAGSNNFNGTNVTIKTTGSGNSEAIRMSGSSTNNYFYDSTVSATNDNDVFFYSSGSGTLNLINTSIVDRSWDGSATHTLNVYWYMDAYVNYTNGSSMSDSTVAAWDKDDNQAFSESTGSSGKISRQTVQEYTQNNSGSNYYSNYTVNASKTDYYTNTTSVNLTTNKLLYFALTEIQPINITLNLDPNPANPNQNVSIYGHANQTDGNNVTNNIVNIYINDSMYYHNNNTGLLENTTAWWNTSWGYRKYIKTESSVSSNLDNAIIMINFSTTNLISEGKMRSDCGDVRFTDSNGNELEYTLETSTCNSPNTVFWVWANLTGSANTTIYPYHGYIVASLKTDYTNPDNDLKLYMHFDKSSEYEENDTFVYDFSRNGNNGTCSGSSCPTWDSNGRFAGAFDFDGSDDYFAVADTDDLNTGGPWTNRTTILWFNANNVTKRQVLYEEGAGTRGFNVYVDDGKVFVGGWNDDAGQSNWPGTFLNTTISVDTWYFVGFVLENGTDSAGPDKFKGYINGSEFDSGDGRKIYAHSADIGIGAMNDGAMFHNGTATGNGYYFNGSIDELRIYNRSLSADEILSIYNSTKDYYIANHSLPRTDGYGNYNYTFNASTTGNYEIKVNTTYYGKYAEANDTLIVQEGITKVVYCQELDSEDTVYELNR
ncbi:MAG: DUF2341 domain-containing protein [Candidatus Aenigmatarchaeota archaeon]|nr:MAG: DUF2341 domain-containing protein [Candidatus Aenigmarchaeota archaeon]